MYNQIYNIDCLEGMRSIPDGSIDFVLCDLPFGMTDCDWDKKIDLKKFWTEINRVTKINAACAMFANGKFLIELAASNLNNYRYKFVWEKSLKVGFLNAKKMPLKKHEDILIFYRKCRLITRKNILINPIKKPFRHGVKIIRLCHEQIGIRLREVPVLTVHVTPMIF